MPSANAHLISMGEFLTSGYSIRGNKSGLRSIPTIGSNYIASMDYNIMHQRLGHPSKAVLRHVQKHTQRFPEIHFPIEDCICPGCALGKMSNRAFPENPRCVLRLVLLAGQGQNRDGSEVRKILTTVHREFSDCAHRCAGKPKCREQD